MTHNEFERLVETAFDAPEDAATRTRIAELTAANPELAAYWEDLVAARNALTGATLEPLPDGLHEAVMAGVRSERRTRRERGGWLGFLSAAISTRPAYALGGAVAAGFAIGVLALGLWQGGFKVGERIGGGVSASLPPMESASATTTLEQDGVRVGITVRRIDGGGIVRIDVAHGPAADLVLAWEPAELRLSGVRWDGPEGPVFDPTSGRVALRLLPGAGSELSFEETVPGSSAIRATLRTPGGDREEMLRLPR